LKNRKKKKSQGNILNAKLYRKGKGKDIRFCARIVGSKYGKLSSDVDHSIKERRCMRVSVGQGSP